MEQRREEEAIRRARCALGRDSSCSRDFDY